MDHFVYGVVYVYVCDSCSWIAGNGIYCWAGIGDRNHPLSVLVRRAWWQWSTMVVKLVDYHGWLVDQLEWSCVNPYAAGG